MEVNLEKNTVTKTDLVSSPILYQCLCMIRTVPEFQNLTYRVTKTQNDVEVVVVYREGVLGIFGPPLDPITLTLDPKGRCQLNILFKPVQRVCIASPDSGQIEIASLLAMLRLIAGKGYLFCPGIPERFLVGKACGKLVVLHRVPFKRYQSSQCPVYYQTPVFQQNNNKSSLCTLCPRCLHAAKLIHTLPTFASNAAGIAAQIPTQVSVSDQRNVVKHTNDNTTGNFNPVSPSKFLSLTNFHNNTTTSVSSELQILKNNISNSEQMSSVDVNGNSQGIIAVKSNNIATDQSTTDRDNTETSVATKVHILKALLKNLLQEEYKKKSMESFENSTKFADTNLKGETGKVPDCQLEDKEHQKKNICRHCKKQYSTPANLLNHLQRHEALTGHWRKKLRLPKLRRRFSFFSSSLHRLFSGSKLPSARNNRKAARLSGTSIRLFLKCLDDIIPSENGAKCLKQQECDMVTDKIVTWEATEKQNISEGVQIVSYQQIKNETHGSRLNLKRTSSGLSPMQTLLEAAAIAEADHSDKNSFLSPSHSSFTLGKYQEAAVVPTTSQFSNVSGQQLDVVSVAQKKPRKSTRLATKRAKNNKKRTREDDTCNEMVEAENASHEQSMLTNLNLLSTVSLETAMTQASISSSIPQTVLSHESKNDTTVFPYTSSTAFTLSTLTDSPYAHSTSKSISISNQLLNNTSGGNVISRSQDTCKPLISTNLQNYRLPPVPPLLFAGDVQGKGLLYPLLSQTQGQSQSGTQAVPVSSPSILRNLVIVGNKQPYPSLLTIPGSETDAVKNHSPNSDCGAIDLSKPKLPQTKANIEKGIDFNFLSGLPHNITQLVAGNENPSEVLQCFMMMANSEGISVPEHKETKPTSAVIGDKKSDTDLQARMFASACKYRIDNGVKKAQHVHSVIASSSRITKPAKGMKSSGATVQTDEIQCGYKWSGSGGSVKERTQLVRELVPPEVMASYFTKSQLSITSPQQLNVSLFNTSQPQQSSPQLVSSSMPGWLTQSKSQNLSASEVALNLITNKAAEASNSKKGVAGRRQISTPSVIVSSPAHGWSPPSPSFLKGNILRTSLTNTSGIIDQLKGHLANTTGYSTTDSSHKAQAKTISLSQTTSPSPSFLSTTPTPPSGCTISSPSLAAILRQPAATMCDTNSKNILNNSHVTSYAALSQRNTNSYSVLSLPRGIHIKTEPTDHFNTEQDPIIISLPIKTESQDTEVGMVVDETSGDADNSLSNLIVDMGPDTAVSRDITEKLKTINTSVSKATDLANNSNSVKYEHRHFIL